MERKEFWVELNKILGFTVPIDGLITMCSGKLTIDITQLDKLVSYRNPDYNENACTYKDEEGVSLQTAIRLIYGDRAVELVNILIS